VYPVVTKIGKRIFKLKSLDNILLRERPETEEEEKEGNRESDREGNKKKPDPKQARNNE
jgi:hypothetical protein